MRVVSLLPAGTEIVTALGASIGETGASLPRLVGVSHECDYPPAVQLLPRVTSTTIDASASLGDIDRAVATAKATGRPAIRVDAERLALLRPDIVLGQSVCDVCAVGSDVLAPALAALPTRPSVVTLHAHTMDGVFADIARVGEAIDLRDEAQELVAGMRGRLSSIQTRPPSRTARAPRILVLEWLDPPYVAGHWVPELVAIAGGLDVGNVAGARSVRRSWEELLSLAPDRVVIALCGFDEARARREVDHVADAQARRLFSRGVEFLDGNAYTSRPGPRLVDAAERLAALINR